MIEPNITSMFVGIIFMNMSGYAVFPAVDGIGHLNVTCGDDFRFKRDFKVTPEHRMFYTNAIRKYRKHYCEVDISMIYREKDSIGFFVKGVNIPITIS